MDKGTFRKKWEALPRQTRTMIAIGTLFGVLVVVSSLVMSVQKAPARRQTTPPSSTNMVLPKARDTSVEGLVASGDATNQEVRKLREQLDREKAQYQEDLRRIVESQQTKSEPTINADVVKELMAMKARLDGIEQGPRKADPLPSLETTPAAEPVASAPVEEGPKIRVVVAEKKDVPAPSAEPPKQPVAYLPPGAMFEAILLNGMDAPTSSVTQKNPVPALLRVKSEAILPNNFSHDIRECFVLVSGFGVLSSERAQLRTETISCTREDGRVVEAKLDGYVVGEDGRVAPRGRLVSKQGQMIAKSLAAGVLSGFGQAITPTGVQGLNLNPSEVMQTQTMDAATVAQSAVGRGFADASKATATFFLDMAKEMTPVVEIDAGRKLTIILIKGLELK